MNKYTKDGDVDKEFSVGKFYVITPKVHTHYVGITDDLELCNALAVSQPAVDWHVAAYEFFNLAMADAEVLSKACGVGVSMLSADFDETVEQAFKRFVHQDTLHIARVIKIQADKEKD